MYFEAAYHQNPVLTKEEKRGYDNIETYGGLNEVKDEDKTKDRLYFITNENKYYRYDDISGVFIVVMDYNLLNTNTDALNDRIDATNAVVDTKQDKITVGNNLTFENNTVGIITQPEFLSVSVADVINPNDATNKNYVDTQITNNALKAGTGVSINSGTKTISIGQLVSTIATPTFYNVISQKQPANLNHLATKNYTDNKAYAFENASKTNTLMHPDVSRLYNLIYSDATTLYYATLVNNRIQFKKIEAGTPIDFILDESEKGLCFTFNDNGIIKAIQYSSDDFIINNHDANNQDQYFMMSYQPLSDKCDFGIYRSTSLPIAVFTATTPIQDGFESGMIAATSGVEYGLKVHASKIKMTRNVSLETSKITDPDNLVNKQYVDSINGTKQNTLTAGTGVSIASNTVSIGQLVSTTATPTFTNIVSTSGPSIDTHAVNRGYLNTQLAIKQNILTPGTGVTLALNTISIGQAVATTNAPTFLNITSTNAPTLITHCTNKNYVDTQLNTKQATLTAGTGVSIASNTVSIGQAVATTSTPTFSNIISTNAPSIDTHAVNLAYLNSQLSLKQNIITVSRVVDIFNNIRLGYFNTSTREKTEITTTRFYPSITECVATQISGSVWLFNIDVLVQAITPPTNTDANTVWAVLCDYAYPYQQNGTAENLVFIGHNMMTTFYESSGTDTPTRSYVINRGAIYAKNAPKATTIGTGYIEIKGTFIVNTCVPPP